MKRKILSVLLSFSAVLLLGCKGNNKKATPSDGTTTVTISLNNYQTYLKEEHLNVSNPFQINSQYKFSGSLSYAIYDVEVTYSGIDHEAGNQGTYKLKLDAGGNGTTILIYGSLTINNVSGTCKYKL